MMHLDNKKKRVVSLFIRDLNVTQLVENCEPKESCPKLCTPSCNKNQVCVYKTITTCGTCPSTYCMDNGQLQVTATNYNTDSGYRKTALIAGLTTGLVVLALIAVTVAGFVYYKRRKLMQNSIQEPFASTNMSSSIAPTTNESIIPIPPMIYLPPTTTTNLNTITTMKPNTKNHHWNQGEEYINYHYEDPQSPFVIGAQSLQIPHLDDHLTSIPDPSNNTIRRSLNITQSPNNINQIDINNYIGLGRASSVKVTKFDNRTYIPANNINNSFNNEDEEDTVSTLRRAVSVKKNSNYTSDTSSIMTRVSSSNNSSQQDIIYAKPKMVRINTIMKRDQSSGMIRKTSIRTIIDDDNSESTPTTSRTTSDNNIDFYICPPPLSSTTMATTEEEEVAVNNINNTSQVSIQSSISSNSTVGDGSITVFLEPSPTIP